LAIDRRYVIDRVHVGDRTVERRRVAKIAGEKLDA
jgi:hypothetical protein